MHEMAVMQQRQIEASASELEERRRLISSAIGPSSSSSTLNQQHSVKGQIDALRSRIVHDEREMAKLGGAQREAKQLAHHNQVQRQELSALESAYTQDDVQLRKAVEKVDSLRKQVFKEKYIKKIFCGIFSSIYCTKGAPRRHPQPLLNSERSTEKWALRKLPSPI